MLTLSDTRSAAASRLRDYFDLQLRFAEAVAAGTDVDFAEAVTFYTNLHRRFGYGRIVDGQVADGWRGYLGQLTGLDSHDARVALTQAFFCSAPPEPLPGGDRQFGCFGYDVPDGQGVVRIHFGNFDSADGTGPLDRSKRDRRMSELARMFLMIRRRHRDARTVVGTSWLYHVPAYRRLFPRQYVQAREVLTAGHRFDGMSSWGQFIDHTGRVKAPVRVAFLRNLTRLDPQRLWTVFPYPALRTEAPVEIFHDHFSVNVRT
ncbi:MAG: hypothetical protein R3E82_13840 [Pseudomonadales bacterium]|nr:hypothetical protein [Pseudomonadales bacterium]